MRLGVVWVHYRTPHLVADAVRSVAPQASALGLDTRQVIVDQSAEPENEALWASLKLERCLPGRNLGYAGGANVGLQRLGDFDFAMVANPDVRLLPGALEALVAALSQNASAVGPRFFWDAASRWLLPPTEERSFIQEVLRILAPAVPWVADFARRQWREWADRHWCASSPIRSRSLSGALLLFSRAAWEQVGPFDESYPLYFEEDDWLARLKKRGLKSVYVPAARAWHLYGQSSSSEPAVHQWFRISAERFRKKHYGPLKARVLERLERYALPRAQGWATLPERFGPLQDLALEVPRNTLLEFSNRPVGFPAVRVSLDGLVDPPGGLVDLAQRSWIRVAAIRPDRTEVWHLRWRLSSPVDPC
jgi:GT2 family glycosyltransferase